MVALHKWLLIAKSGCTDHSWQVFFKLVKVLMSRLYWEKEKVPLSLCIQALSFKPYLYNCEADSLTRYFWCYLTRNPNKSRPVLAERRSSVITQNLPDGRTGKIINSIPWLIQHGTIAVVPGPLHGNLHFARQFRCVTRQF